MGSSASPPMGQRTGDAPQKRHALLANLALTFVVVLICLGAMELATRWMLSDLGTTGDQTSYLSIKWAKQHPPSINRLGFRDHDFAPQAKPGVYRIAAIGDSFTYGSGLLDGQRVSDRIAAALDDRYPGRFEIVNFGVPGANYAQHAANLDTAIREARPDFILLQWYQNDLDDPAEKRPNPRQLGSRWHHQLNGMSALYMLAAQFFSDIQVRLGLVNAGAYYARFNDPADPLAQRAEQRLQKILEVARGAGIPVGIYLWPELTRPIGTSPNDVLIEHMLATCHGQSIQCVDLRPALAGEHDHQKLIINRFDTHGSAYANALAARSILARFQPIWVEQAKALQERGGPDGTRS